MGANDQSSRKQKTKVSFHLTPLHFLCISSSHAVEIAIFGRPFAMLSDVYTAVCPSATLVYCDQTAVATDAPTGPLFPKYRWDR